MEGDVSQTPAFHFLRTLEQNGDIGMDIAHDLRQKYVSLHEVVIQTAESEKTLLRKAKELNGTLTNVQNELDNTNAQTEALRNTLAELKVCFSNALFPIKHSI